MDIHYRHWLPVITFCPYNGAPDPLYVTVMARDAEPVDLREVRRVIRNAVQWKKVSMEDAAVAVERAFETAFGVPPSAVTVKLLFNRHTVEVKA